MARPLRVEFADAVYHVMARGNEGRSVFRDDEDRRRFLDTLAEMVERFGVGLHAYRGGSSVGQVVRRVEQRSVEDVKLRKKLAMIKANLSRVES